jgi:hypothetical protein
MPPTISLTVGLLPPLDAVPEPALVFALEFELELELPHAATVPSAITPAIDAVRVRLNMAGHVPFVLGSGWLDRRENS